MVTSPIYLFGSSENALNIHPKKIEFEPGYAIEYAGYELRKGQLDLSLMQDSFDKLSGGVNSDSLPVNPFSYINSSQQSASPLITHFTKEVGSLE